MQKISNTVVDLGVVTFADRPDYDTGNLNIEEKGFSGKTLIVGSNNDNNYAGSYADNWIYGNGEADTIVGGGGADHLHSGTGSDPINGGIGDIIIEVGEKDNIEASSGTHVEGGTGDDAISIGHASARHTNDLAAQIYLADGDPGDKIVWNGHLLSGGTFKVINDPEPNSDFVPTQWGVVGYVGDLGEVYQVSGGNIHISLPDNTFLHMQFTNGDYGLTFADEPSGWYGPSVERTNNAHDHSGFYNPFFGPNLAQLFAGINGRQGAFDNPGSFI